MSDTKPSTGFFGADRLDIYAAVLMGLATVLGALAAYESALWGGNTNALAQKAIYQLTDSNKDYLEAISSRNALAFTDFQEDYLYLEWGKALDKGDHDGADYLLSKMSPEGQQALSSDNEKEAEKAFEAYQARLAGEEAAADEKVTKAIETFQATKGMMEASKVANDNGDRFTFTVVLFTIVLFFAGMTGLTRRFVIKAGYLGLAAAVFAYASVSLGLIPFA